jgi:DNA-binding PucR family transcriptional regulator
MAAATLGLGRQTVTDRVRIIEEQIGRPPEECLAELDLALRLCELS